MKLTIQILTLGVLIAVSAAASAQTTFKYSTATTSSVLQKPVINQIAVPTAPAPAEPDAAPCSTTYDPAAIAAALRTQWVQEYQDLLKSRMTAYNGCLNDCVSRSNVSGVSIDSDDPKDYAFSLVQFCQEVCS